MKIKANGITINFDISGRDNAPWLIFSNSLATNLHMWDPQAADLKGEFRMLRYEQRGHGETEATAGRYTFELPVESSPEPFIAELAATGGQLVSVSGLRTTLEDVFMERVR